MEAASGTALDSTNSSPVWRLDWLTPARCRLLLAILLVLGFLGHLRYLTHDCPIDLSGDEAHYWDWSRQLDLSYYSKGPLVAYIIRASCAIFGDTMPAVRLPAVILAMGTSVLTYWLASKLFQSERIALGAVLLNHLVPMFVAGSVMMTIDPPFFFCWAAATCLAAKALMDGSRWVWPVMGIAIGLGFLAKYSMFLWLVGLGCYVIFEPDSRRWLKTPWPWLMLIVAIAFTTPVIVWNQRHGWVSLRHVSRQTGTSEGKFNIGNLAEFLVGQIIAIGPALAAILIAAVWSAIRVIRIKNEKSRIPLLFLVCMGLPFFVLVALTSFRAKIQVNWPAPAYFSLMILAAGFLASRLASRELWRPWRPWFWGTVIFGIAMMPIAHNTELLYPAVAWLGHKVHGPGDLPESWRKWDPTYKLRGWKELGQVVSKEKETLGPGAFIMAEKYDFAAELAFYVKGQPKTYYVGSWFADYEHRRARSSQYDLWPDRRLDKPELLGKDAIFFGYDPPPDLIAAFDSVEKIPDVRIDRRGFNVRVFHLWKCRGFKGMTKPEKEGRF